MIFFATAQTGTGKTVHSHCLLSSIYWTVVKDLEERLAPYSSLTRELAAQIAQNIKDYVKYTELSVSAVYGGNKMSSQVRQLELVLIFWLRRQAV